MKKILIIGKKGFIALNLIEYLNKKNFYVSSIDYKNFLKRNESFNKKFDYILNCTSNKNFIQNKYKTTNDHDLIIAKKIKNCQVKLIIFSSRKIYKPKINIKESDLIKPICNYSKNKFLSVNFVQKILLDKFLILRVSNIIGYPNNNKRKLHKTFVDIFFEKAIKGYIYDNKNIYKDFLTIKKFNEIVYQLIKKNASGTYNVSLGKKVYLSQITKWLNFYNNKKIKIINLKKSFNNDNFTLNNDKLINKIKIKYNLIDLKKECLTISRKFFLKK